MASSSTGLDISENDLQGLQSRMDLIVKADPKQFHNTYALKRYLKAFKTVDAAFQAILKTNKWRTEFGVDSFTEDIEFVKSHKDKASVLKHRDLFGRPIVFVDIKTFFSEESDIDELTKFIVYCLETACKKCFEEVIDNILIIFDMNQFNLSFLENKLQLTKNLIWLLSRHYPERLGHCLILNSSTVFMGVYQIVKGWLDETTTTKIVFINSEEELCKYLIPDILPIAMKQ